jgi:glycerol-3-phosphate acyltransferase PlsY
VSPLPRKLGTAAALGYLAGSLPSADIVSRAVGDKSVDLRQHGSGNPGALNAAAVLGSKWGLVVLGADVAKGAAAGIVGRAVAGEHGAYLGATAAIAGHIAPAWSGFRGGKGVATSAGACLAVFPMYFPVDVVVAATAAATSRRAEGAVRLSCMAWVATAVAAWRFKLPNAWGPEPSPSLVAFAVAGSAMILAKFAATRRPRPLGSRATGRAVMREPSEPSTCPSLPSRPSSARWP